jgi:hypothetical protein
MTVALTIMGSLGAAAIAAVLAHRLTSRRDHANRRSDLRVEYLLTAYRQIANAAHRELGPDTGDLHALEQGLSDIQLLGSAGQVGMAHDIAKKLGSTGTANVDDLLQSLRDDLRSELQLEPLDGQTIYVRIVPKDQVAS